MTDEHRPIPGLEGYAITRQGAFQVHRTSRSPSTASAGRVGNELLAADAPDPGHKTSISRATMDAWGSIDELTAEQRLWFNTDAIQLYDHLVATYRPQRQWRKKMRRAVSEEDYGKRGLLQVVGKIGTTEIPGANGEWALMPRESGWARHRYPLCDFKDIEPAPPGAGKYDANAAMERRLRERSDV